MKVISSIIVASFLVWVGCMTATYLAPNTSSVPIQNYSRVIDKSFDQTWSALIQYAGSAFFGIEHFEKQSGLLTLSFGATRPSDFVTGGHWKTSGVVQFDGEYVDYCTKHVNGALQGKMNVIVVALEPNKTKVTVKARYVFTCGNAQVGIETWSFDSGGFDTQKILNSASGAGDSRTLMPTYKAEKAILDAIAEIR
jgi:hypothetical protein